MKETTPFFFDASCHSMTCDFPPAERLRAPNGLRVFYCGSGIPQGPLRAASLKKVTGQVTWFRTIHHQRNGKNMRVARNHEKLDSWDPWSAPVVAF